MQRTTTDLLAKLEAFGARSEALYGAESPLDDESGEEEARPLSPASGAGCEHTDPYAAEPVGRLSAAEHRPAVDVREDSRRRPQRAPEKENHLRASREELPPPAGACLQINARSRELEREGDVGERLYEEARAKADRQELARAEVEREARAQERLRKERVSRAAKEKEQRAAMAPPIGATPETAYPRDRIGAESEGL